MRSLIGCTLVGKDDNARDAVQFIRTKELVLASGHIPLPCGAPDNMLFFLTWPK